MQDKYGSYLFDQINEGYYYYFFEQSKMEYILTTKSNSSNTRCAKRITQGTKFQLHNHQTNHYVMPKH